MKKTSITKELVWRYTKAKYLPDTLQGKDGVYASHVRFLSDSIEYKYGLHLIKKVIQKEIDKLKRDNAKSNLGFLDEVVNNLLCVDAEDNLEKVSKLVSSFDVFVACFSQKQDDLSMWRGYTPDGGVCVGFDQEELIDTLFRKRKEEVGGIQYYFDDETNKLTVYGACLYGGKELRKFIMRNNFFSIDVLIGLKNKYELVQRICILASLCKAPSFKDEAEKRIAIAFSQKADKGKCGELKLVGEIPRILALKIESSEVSKLIKKIYISPHGNKCKYEELINLFIQTLNLAAIKVKKSKIPYNGK